MENYYAVLEVEKTATKKEIKKSYYRLAKKYHPDHNPDDPQAAERFKLVGEAYRVLSDDASRADYDQKLASGGTAPQGQGAPGGTQAARPKAAPKQQAPAGPPDFSKMQESFSRFWGFDPKSKEVTNEDKLNTYVPKDPRKNPLDTTAAFEKFFLGMK